MKGQELFSGKMKRAPKGPYFLVPSTRFELVTYRV